MVDFNISKGTPYETISPSLPKHFIRCTTIILKPKIQLNNVNSIFIWELTLLLLKSLSHYL